MSAKYKDDFYMSRHDREVLEELKMYEKYERERDERAYQEYLQNKKYGSNTYRKSETLRKVKNGDL